MSGFRFSRLPIVTVLVFAAVIAFAAVISSSVEHPQVAVAQNIYCGGNGYQSVICPSNPVGLQCNSVGVDANGNNFCTSLATTSCPNGVTVNFGFPCPGNGCTGAGQCYNNPYGLGAGAVGIASIGVCGLTLVMGPCPQTTTGPGGATAGQVNCGGGRYAPSAAACAPANATAGVTATTAYTPPATASTGTGAIPGPSNGVSVTFPAGWNLVSAPDGTVLSGVGGSLSTLQPGDTSYETQPSTAALKGGRGYWAYFASSSTQMLPLTTSGSVTMTLPARTPVMVGNPSSSNATVTGATTLSAFDPSTNQYVATTSLKPGQGAWAESDSGGTVTIASAG